MGGHHHHHHHGADDLSIFPPGDHEGLHLHRNRYLQQSKGEGEEDDEEGRTTIPSFSGRVFGTSLEFLYSRVVIPLRRRARSVRCRLPVLGLAFTSFFFFFVVVVVYVSRKWSRQGRERTRLLLLILQEKEQKIARLMHQVAQANELLSARHKVSVLRLK